MAKDKITPPTPRYVERSHNPKPFSTSQPKAPPPEPRPPPPPSKDD